MPAKHKILWALGIITSFIGVVLARKTPSGSITMFVGYFLGFAGLAIIVFAINNKAVNRNSDKDAE